MSQIVQVVSIDEVMISFGESLFQSKDVKGAVCSGVLLLESKANGCSFCGTGSRVLAFALRLMLLVMLFVEAGRLHSLKWSPLVAKRSVYGFVAEGGSHSSLVTGYAHVASATFVYSRP